MLKVQKVRMEYLENPVGVSGLPWFGWVLDSDGNNIIQRAYQLQLAFDESFLEPAYDSGWVESEESVHVTAEGCRVEACTKYYVRVRVRDDNEESGFSDTAYFVTGILNSREWKASFITAETPEDKDNSKSTYLRKDISLSGRVKNAYVCTTALGLYHFYINGEKVGRDQMAPGWTSYHKHLCYQTHEVTSLLEEGDNTLAAMVGAGWYKGKMGFLHLRNNYGERTAFLMQLLVRYEDGREEIFATDESWCGMDGAVTFSEIYDGEQYDARLECPGWKERGSDIQGFRTVETLDFPMEALTAQPGSRVTAMEMLPAKEVFVTPKGETVIDFGQNLTGWVDFRIRGTAGAEAVLRCFETLDAAGNVYTDNLRTAKQTIGYICKGDGAEEYHPYFTFQGFRYIQILSWPSRISKEDFTAHALYSNMEQTGTFRCSNPLVNQLQHNILWGLKGNFLDIPTDCPQRDERMGWTGDAQIFCRTACYLMNTYTFFRKWLKDVAADQTVDGGVPHVVPDIISGKEEDDWLLSQGTHSAAAWADVAVINPWTMYLIYGDKVILEEQYESMKKWIQFMENHARDYIWNYKLQFGDWVALDAEEGSYFGATPNDLTCTAYYAYSTRLFAKIAGILGRESDEREYSALYEKITDKFRRTFFTEEGDMTAQTQTAHIVALYFDLVPEQLRARTAQRLVELLEKENGHLVTGFVGTPYFCHALSQNGYVKEAYKLLQQEDFPSWLYQVKKGATTVWEHWDGLKPDGTMWSADMNSFNHYAYGAVGDWLYRVVLGMEVDEKDPGYHHSIISPQTGEDFAYAEGTFESAYGPLKVRWDKGAEENERLLKVTIPHNTTAELRLEKGAKILQAGGLCFTETAGIWAAHAGSGTWTIAYSR